MHAIRSSHHVLGDVVATVGANDRSDAGNRVTSKLRRWLATVLTLCAAGAAGNASAQVPRALINNGFEIPAISCNSPGWNIVDATAVPGIGWTTTAGPGAGVRCSAGAGTTAAKPIEVWLSGFGGVPAHGGRQFVELNAYVSSRLYQRVCLIQGETYSYSISHRGRSGVETMNFGLNPDGDTALSVAMPLNGLPVSATNPIASVSTGTTAWNTVTGSSTFQGATGIYQFGFRSVADGAVGNFIDDAFFGGLPLLEISPNQNLQITEGQVGNLKLRVSGTFTANITVNLRVSGGTATYGTDYTLPNGSPAGFTLSIPAGAYVGTDFDVPITALNDTVLDDGETVIVEVLDGPGYVLASTSSCGSPASVSNTVTILDAPADMAAALSGFPANANAGSVVTGTATCTNLGPGGAPGATCSFPTLPPGASVSCSPQPPAALALNEAISCSISFVVPPTGSVGVEVDAASSVTDPAPANNSASTSIGVTPLADMRASTAIPLGAVAGTPVTVSGTCTNDGPSPAVAPTCTLTGLPAGATFSCAPSVGTLAAGSWITCTSSFTAPTSGTLNITTTAGSSTADPQPGNNVEAKGLGVTPQADVASTTSLSASTAAAGTSVTVTGTCINKGPSDAATPTCALSGLPSGATQSCAPAPNPLTVNSSITCTSTFNAPASGPLTITTTAGTTTNDPKGANNVSNATLTVTPRADMKAAITVAPATVKAGQSVTVTGTCTNGGPSEAVAPIVCELSGLPPGATLSCTPSPAPSPMAAGAVITCSSTFTAPASGTLDIALSTSSGTTDPDTSNNTAHTTTSINPQADMTATTTVPGSVTAGQPVTVSGTCTNSGVSPAAAPSCTLTGLPPGATSTCTPNPVPATLALNESITCTSTFTAPSSGTFNILTTAGTTTEDPSPVNNTSTKTLAITPAADLVAAISGIPPTAAVGSTVSGTITCSNQGPSAATDASCTVTGLPADATISCTPTPPVASLAAGEAITCQVRFKVGQNTLASLTVVTGSSTVDPDRSNNVSTLNFGAAELQAVPVPLSPTLSALVGGLLALCGAAALRRGRAP